MSDVISGEIPVAKRIVCTIDKPKRIIGVFGRRSDEIKGIVTGTTPKEEYDGAYVIIPGKAEQVLETKLKYMNDDVTVKEIPYAEVSNLSGGKTATIG